MCALALGTGAIAKAFQREHATKMLESNRISPMSSFTVVLGYVFGPTMPVLLLYVVGVVIGLVLASLAARDPSAWLVGNFYLLIVSVSIWCLAVLVGVGPGKPGNLTSLVVVGGLLSIALMAFVPGVALLVGAYGITHSQRHMLGGLGSTAGLGLALAAAVLMLVFWAVCAARYYRKPQLPPLTVPAALLFVGLFLFMSLVGVLAHGELVVGRLAVELGNDSERTPMVLLTVGLVTTLSIGHLPAAAAVRMRRRRTLGERARSGVDTCSPPLATVLSLAVVFVASAVVIAASRPPEVVADLSFGVCGVIALALALAFWTVTGALRCSYFASGKNTVAAIVIVLLWLGPPLVDYVRVALSSASTSSAASYSLLLGCSPVFTIICACNGINCALCPGLVFQAVVAGLAHLLGNRAERLLVKRRAWMLAEESQMGRPDGVEIG